MAGRRIAILLLSVAVGFGVLEGGARVAERRAPGAAIRTDDPLLEYRIEPNTGGHDGRGYRNGETLARADVVALGDSQTWGENAPIDESWPAQLATMTGLRVYNMGRGGYGALQYVAQLEQALQLEPGFVVVALYFGNDFFDAYNLAYGYVAHLAWRHPEPEVRRQIVSSEYPDLKRMLFERVSYHRGRSGRAAWLREETAIGRLTARALSPVDPRADRAWAEDYPDEGFVYDAGGLSTVFHTTYRLAAVDTRLPRIEEGVRITEASLAALKQQTDRAPETRLLIALLPTKERVFDAAIEAANVPTPQSYRESVAFERKLTARLVAWMSAQNIAHVETLPALEAAVARGEAIFPPNADGHFTSEGYALIAQAVASAIEADQAR